MREVVVITTDDLEPAVRLRARFLALGLDVELLTPSESLDDVAGDPLLLILSGSARTERGRRLIDRAREKGGLPVIAFLEPGDYAGRENRRALGVTECLSKPIDVEEAALVGRRIIERERLRGITGIAGDTEVMEEVLERVVRIAGVDSTVLVQGESGTGKELIARGLHALSSRRHRPFIAVNVAALPETLLESELFGHEKGAFTGAVSLRKGLFELAHGGTVFLDEIGEMPLSTQTKLLRVLEEREFRRVGGEESLTVDVRVIAATNRNLRDQVDLGQFRRDLYHRLNVLRIELPALRERREDIPVLIDRFVREFSRHHDRPFPGIDNDALRILIEYAWPGNVRELRNLIESMVVLAHRQPIHPADLPAEVREARGVYEESCLRRNLPVVVSRPASSAPAEQPASSEERAGALVPASPEMEFILRTIFDLRIDVDELRREMENSSFRERRELEVPYPSRFAATPVRGDEGGIPGGREVARTSAPVRGDEVYTELSPVFSGAKEDTGIVVFRTGMTMRDMEREAISATLREVRGNRRRAAEILDIGERTLYRKIKEYNLEG
jgi:DNA-binding NtrC family response regulator